MKLLFVLSFALTLTSNCFAQEWRGIQPLQSTCEDVKRDLKADACTLPISQYTLPDFQVMVEFETETCDKEPRAWKVPKGTVTAITISPRNEMRPSEFGLDLSKYKKRDGDIVGLVHYDSEAEGVTVDLYQGFVQSLFLYPKKSETALRCKPLN